MRIPAPASILATFSPLPFMVFEAGGNAIIDLSDAGSEIAEVHISPRDLPALRALLRRLLRAIVGNHDISQADRSWAIHRAMLYETAAAFQQVNERIPTGHLLNVSLEAVRFQAHAAGTFPYLDIFFSVPYSSVTHAVKAALTAIALASTDRRFGAAGMTAIAIGALFADVSKLTMPTEILMRDGPLNIDEWRLMRQHTIRSAEVMHRSGIVIPSALRATISHHELTDGSGYPDMLRGDDIPMEARHVAIADIFSAMTADRAFQARVDPFDALTEMSGDGGGGLDPSLLRTFVQLVGGLDSHDERQAA